MSDYQHGGPRTLLHYMTHTATLHDKLTTMYA